jgi:hypothetical protein
MAKQRDPNAAEAPIPQEVVLVFLKPSDSLSFTQLLKENRITRSDVYAIGVPCQDTLDGGAVCDSCKGKKHVSCDELIGVKEDEQDGKIKMTASIAVDGRIDVEFYVDKDATVDDIKEAAENAFMEADLSDMEVVNSSPVNAESVDGITVPFFDFD